MQQAAIGLPDRMDAAACGGYADRFCSGPGPAAGDCDRNVTDQSGQPVIGATVIEQGTTNGATTGVDGTYTLKLRGGGILLT